MCAEGPRSWTLVTPGLDPGPVLGPMCGAMFGFQPGFSMPSPVEPGADASAVRWSRLRGIVLLRHSIASRPTCPEEGTDQ
jgi:hypothetical protein